MPSIYRADTYCDSCALRIAAELDDEGTEDNGDSDTYPQTFLTFEETDSPDHCASNAACLEGIDLCDYGMSPDATLLGAESRHIGALLSEGLSIEGLDYVRDEIESGFRTAYPGSALQTVG